MLQNETNVCSATYARLQRGTARIRRPHAAAAEIDRYILPAGLTAANLQQQGCCCGSVLEQTDRQTDGHRTVSWTLPAYCAGSANKAF